MLYDICQSPVSISDEACLSEWNSMIRAFLAHGTSTPAHLGAVLEANPNLAIGHAARGIFSLMMGRAEMVQTAHSAAQTARRSAQIADTTDRERAWIDALDQWLNGNPTAAIAALERSLDRYPGDTLTAKVSHAIRFILGDAKGMRWSIERVMAAHTDDHACRGYAMGCHAFTLEETGAYDLAEKTGRAGLEFAPDDAWGLHAVAHVFDMTARPDLGIRLIEDHENAWDHCNNFRYHVWWHKALLHLDKADYETVLGLYDAQVRADKTDDYRDISNATSLLMRLELDGVEVGHRWDEIADLAENRINDGCVVFADLHYMLALTGAKRENAAQNMISRFSMDASRQGDMPERYADPGVAAIDGLNAFAEGRYTDAFASLSQARTKMQSIGGSHAQRDVFERLTIDAGIRAGRYAQTQSILADRLSLRGGHADRFTESRLETLRSSTGNLAAQ